MLLPSTLLTPFYIVAEITWAHDTAYLMITLPKFPCGKLEPHDLCSGKKYVTEVPLKGTNDTFFHFLFCPFKLVDMMMEPYIENRVQD